MRTPSRATTGSRQRIQLLPHRHSHGALCSGCSRRDDSGVSTTGSGSNTGGSGNACSPGTSIVFFSGSDGFSPAWSRCRLQYPSTRPTRILQRVPDLVVPRHCSSFIHSPFDTPRPEARLVPSTQGYETFVASHVIRLNVRPAIRGRRALHQ